MNDIIFNKAILAKNLKDLLAEKKLTAPHLAEITGISKPTIWRYMNEALKKRPNKKYIREIAQHLKVNIRWLLRGEGPKDAIEEETKPVEYARYPEACLLDECLEMFREILILDRKSFFVMKASVEGVLSALKEKGQEDIKQVVERRHGERRTISQPIELERRRNNNRRKSKEELMRVSVPD